jgi:hypothetical protein
MRLWQSTITKKLRRREVLPTAMDPNWPQSTWAQSPGAKASVRKAGVLGGRTWWTIVLDNADAAAVAAFAQTLEDLRGGVRMRFEPADDLLLEGIELAGTHRPFSRAELVGGQPPGDGEGMQVQLAGDLRCRQMAALVVVVDLAVQFIVNHEAPSINRRRI